MLVDQAAIDFLASVADEAEESRAAYWEHAVSNFSVNADGTVTGRTNLGNASRNVSALRNCVHYLLQRPLCRFAGEFKDFPVCERLGREIARRQNRQFTYDMLRQALSLALIRHYLTLDAADDCNLIIGDGYGVMTALLLMHAPHRRTIVANLTKPLLLDLIYVRQAVPDVGLALVSTGDEMRAALADGDIRLIAVRADDMAALYEAPIGLAVNIVSMQEMDPPVIARYFSVLRRNRVPNTAFYCCNKLVKTSSFQDYPWHPGDRVLHDSVCPWAQWYYDTRPPFWHQRPAGDKRVWHRLTMLRKEPS